MALGKNKKMAIKISDTAINILIGNKNRIYETHNIALENGVCKDGTVRDTDNIIELLNEYLDVNARDVKDVSFVLRGSDIITRYIEVPILKDDALREAVNYEFRQFIPEIDDYYTNYEIIEKINTQEKKAYKILLVAATRTKIDPIVEIAEGINKELEVIDVLSNTVARVLRSSEQIIREESTGVFYFGSDSSTLTIIEDNILKFERNLPFGVKNIFNEAYLEMSASTLDIKEIEDVFDRNPNLTNSFQNLLSSVNNTIRYYNSDKKNKPVTNFIIICADMIVNNMEKYLEKYFELPCLLIKDPIDLGLKIKFEDNFAQYIALYGLFLRYNNKKLLNLNPKSIDKAKGKGNLDKLLVTLTSTVLILLMVISVPFIIINSIISKDIASAEAEIIKYAEIIEKNTQLKSENSKMEYFINRIKNIENSTTKTSEILAKVNTYVPKEITFMSLSFSDSGSINISGESDTYSAIPEFLANLEMSEEFSNVKISYINPVEKTIEVSKANSNISTRNSLMPIAMVGTSNIWEEIILAADDTQENNNQNNNSENNINNSQENNTENEQDSENSNGSNVQNNNSQTDTNKKTNTIIKYSFSISMEGVS